MAKCPFCNYTTPAQESGATQMWQEIAHMQTVHPEVISERLRSAGVLDFETGFGPISQVTLHIPGDMSIEDFKRLVEIVSETNQCLDLKDKQVQRIETTLDTALLDIERKNQ